MVQRFALAALAALALAGCEAPDSQIFVSPAYDRAWARERQLCAANPRAAHCDVYLRNEIPPAPYSADGILIVQRRLCFESRSVADCTLAQRLGREGELGPAPAASPVDEDETPYVPAPVVTGNLGYDPETAATPRRAPRRAAPSASPSQCSPAALDSLDLVEAPVRAAILRRCATAR